MSPQTCEICGYFTASCRVRVHSGTLTSPLPNLVPVGAEPKVFACCRQCYAELTDREISDQTCSKEGSLP